MTITIVHSVHIHGSGQDTDNSDAATTPPTASNTARLASGSPQELTREGSRMPSTSPTPQTMSSTASSPWKI